MFGYPLNCWCRACSIMHSQHTQEFGFFHQMFLERSNSTEKNDLNHIFSMYKASDLNINNDSNNPMM